jgi:hypothetical protein
MTATLLLLAVAIRFSILCKYNVGVSSIIKAHGLFPLEFTSAIVRFKTAA